MGKFKHASWVLAAALARWSTADIADSAIQHVAHSVVYDPSTALVTFSVTFDRAPDFYTLDEYGHQKDTFQFYLDTDPLTYWPASRCERLLRGGEIHIDGDVRVRATWPPVPDPNSGGWGPIVGVIPYTLQEHTVVMVLPFAVVGTETGVFAFDLLVGSYGAGSTVAYNEQSSLIPQPTIAVWLLAAAGGNRRRDR